jgi:predicted house-cleaning noncanonical NTP pyrophosphatase (MazG superfamily)
MGPDRNSPARHAPAAAVACRRYGQAMLVRYNKLVRDRIPEIIAADGRLPVVRILDQAGYRAALKTKLVEEAQEANAATAADLPEELADVLEVLQAMVCTLGITWEDFLAITARKRAENGGFIDRIYLEYVTDHAGR